MSSLKQLRKVLKEDSDVKRDYINARAQDMEDINASVECKTDNINLEIFQQLLKSQQENIENQKTIYELRSEIDTEEVKSRYIKLDLNNATVKSEDLKEDIVNIKKKHWDILLKGAGIVGVLFAMNMTTFLYLLNRQCA